MCTSHTQLCARQYIYTCTRTRAPMPCRARVAKAVRVAAATAAAAVSSRGKFPTRINLSNAKVSCVPSLDASAEVCVSVCMCVLPHLTGWHVCTNARAFLVKLKYIYVFLCAQERNVGVSSRIVRFVSLSCATSSLSSKRV